ncbi:MAG: FISUMP domain-containing protein [Bacteroidia bacterium]
MPSKLALPAFLILLLCSVRTVGNSALSDWKILPGETIKIGNQVWMKKNVAIPMPNSFWYERDSAGNAGNGRLYFFSSALAVCPKGWHLPTDLEWSELMSNFGGDSLAGLELQKGGKSGLDLPLAGYRSANSNNDLFGKKNEQGFYWTSTVKGEQTAYAKAIQTGSTVVTDMYYRRANAFSVRFIKDQPH